MKGVSLGLRVTPEFKSDLEVLIQLISQDIGTTVSQTQAVEMAVREALARRKGDKNNNKE